MARRCIVTGKGVQVGNSVSHANNKTRRRWLPNLQAASLYSDALRQAFPLRLSLHGLRTIEHRGGLDAFLLGVADADLPRHLRQLKKRVKAARASV